MTARSDSGRLRTVSFLSENPWEERREERNTVSGRERASLKCEAANRKYCLSSDARATRGLRLGRWPLAARMLRSPSPLHIHLVCILPHGSSESSTVVVQTLLLK